MALIGYAVASVFALAAIVYRYTLWITRPPTWRYLKTGCPPTSSWRIDTRQFPIKRVRGVDRDLVTFRVLGLREQPARSPSAIAIDVERITGAVGRVPD